MEHSTMTKTFDLTANELKVAMILVNECLAGMGGERPADLEHDEYTWADPKDLQRYGYSRHEAAGFWSSLMAKGFIYEYDKNEFVVATQAWKFIDTVWDANQNLLPN
jgi:hypothetical protein